MLSASGKYRRGGFAGLLRHHDYKVLPRLRNGKLRRVGSEPGAVGENIDRLGFEASSAHPCGTAPVPASSGRTSRHRLNFAGNRDANRALHMIVIVRLRYCERPAAT